MELISAPGISHTQDQRVEAVRAIGEICKAEQKEVLETLHEQGLTRIRTGEDVERSAPGTSHPRDRRAEAVRAIGETSKAEHKEVLEIRHKQGLMKNHTVEEDIDRTKEKAFEPRQSKRLREQAQKALQSDEEKSVGEVQDQGWVDKADETSSKANDKPDYRQPRERSESPFRGIERGRRGIIYGKRNGRALRLY